MQGVSDTFTCSCIVLILEINYLFIMQKADKSQSTYIFNHMAWYAGPSPSTVTAGW